MDIHCLHAEKKNCFCGVKQHMQSVKNVWTWFMQTKENKGKHTIYIIL